MIRIRTLPVAASERTEAPKLYVVPATGLATLRGLSSMSKLEVDAGPVTRQANPPTEPPATRVSVALPPPFQPERSVSNDEFVTRLVQPPPDEFTVTVRVAGEGSARPSASVTVNDTV